MQRVKFTYSEWNEGTFENEGPEMNKDEILGEIRYDHPEADAIHILEIENV